MVPCEHGFVSAHQAVGSQRGKDPPEEGPGHLGSWQPPVGEIRVAKRCDKGPLGVEQACGLRLPRRHVPPERIGVKEEPSLANTGEGHGRREDPGERRRRTSRRTRKLNASKVTHGNGEARPGPHSNERLEEVGVPYKLTKRSRGPAGRESGGVIVPAMAVQQNAAGGKDPYLVARVASRYARVNAGDG